LNENGQFERVIRKRKRKSGEQLKALVREFDKNPNWSKETLLEISKKSGLSEA
jgi:ribonuclease P protein component